MNKRRAMISVSDKTGLLEFAKKLVELNFEIISTGGTKKTLEDAKLNVLDVQDITQFEEMLGGRVKTLHPNIHGGILARRDNSEDMQSLQKYNISPIDLVVVNLYPFKETISNPACTKEQAIENIDIGGPSLLRAAAKNYLDVTVIVDYRDYDNIIEALKKDSLSQDTRFSLACKAFRHTASYDATISQYLSHLQGNAFSETYTFTGDKQLTLRYGENPHQKAALYCDTTYQGSSLTQAKQLHGKELSFNNIQDIDAALAIISDFDEPAVVAIKHANPCGVATANSIFDAFEKAYQADPISIFGGIIAVNREVDVKTAIAMNALFLEVIIAPSYEQEAFEVLSKKKNIRLLFLPAKDLMPMHEIKSIAGGFLVQERDAIENYDYNVVTKTNPDENEMKELLFAWKIVKHVKSNAIVIATNDMTIGVGAGQMNRVGAAKIALEQANEKAKGAVLASDAFFPMPDTIELAAKYGIRAIIQPGGSIQDQSSIEACNKHNIAMVFTHERHFKH